MKLFIQQWMMEYLRKRGWVVFYLDKEHRTCSKDTCWLRLYEDGQNATNELKDEWKNKGIIK